MGDGSKDRYINTPSSLTMILSRVLLLFDSENVAIRIGMTCPITLMVLPISRKKVNLTKAFLISPSSVIILPRMQHVAIMGAVIVMISI